MSSERGGQEMAPQEGTTTRALTEEGIIHIPGLHSRWVRLSNGAKAHYVTSGETGPPVLMLHGGLQGSSGTAGWRFQAPFLGANGFRVYCPDMPGYGLSDTKEEYWPKNGQKDHLDFLKMFIDALCLDKVHITGNSMGAGNTTQFVINHPDRVLSAVFIAGPGATGPGDPVIPLNEGKFTPKPDFDRARIMTLWDGTEETMAEMMNSIIHKPAAIWPELLTMRNMAALNQKESNAAYFAANRKNAESASMRQLLASRDRLCSSDIPMITFWGLQDVFSIVDNGFIGEQNMRNAQWFYPDECGHQGQTDQPEIFNQCYLEFFRDGKVSWETAQRAGVSRRFPIQSRYVQEPAGGFPPPIPEAYTDIQTLRAAIGAVAAT